MKHLPRTILAVFVKRLYHEEDWSDDEEGEEPQKKIWAREHYERELKHSSGVHADFLREYGLSARDVPLLEYDPIAWTRAGGKGGSSGELPFRDISPPGTWSL